LKGKNILFKLCQDPLVQFQVELAPVLMVKQKKSNAVCSFNATWALVMKHLLPYVDQRRLAVLVDRMGFENSFQRVFVALLFRGRQSSIVKYPQDIPQTKNPVGHLMHLEEAGWYGYIELRVDWTG